MTDQAECAAKAAFFVWPGIWEQNDRRVVRDSGSTGPLANVDRTRSMTAGPIARSSAADSASQPDQKAFISTRRWKLPSQRI